MTHLHTLSARCHTTPHQRGVVLAMSLIFLAILSLVALFAMRSSILGEQVSKNIRSNEVARQAAETALRYCENQVRTGAIAQPAPSLDQSGLPADWQTRTNIFDTSKSIEVPSTQLVASGMQALPVLPRCFIASATLPLAPGEGNDPNAGASSMNSTAVWITAVGFSADYERKGSALTDPAISGGEVWLQSILTL